MTESFDPSLGRIAVRDFPALEASSLYYYYGSRCVVRGASFKVAAGSIHGLVGPNGAGKTTILEICALLLPQRSGHLKFLGRSVSASRQIALRRRIGFMPDGPRVYESMSVFEYLDFFGAAFDLTEAQRDERVPEVLALVGLTGCERARIGDLSLGTQQRVALARTLLHHPSLLLLDEPANALDPRARWELSQVLRQLRDRGKTILVSSHILTDLVDLCDAVTVLDRGDVVYSGTLDELLVQNRSGVAYELELASPVPELCGRLRDLPDVIEAEPAADCRLRLRLATTETALNTTLATALAAGARVVGFRPDRDRLNLAYLEHTAPAEEA